MSNRRRTPAHVWMLYGILLYSIASIVSLYMPLIPAILKLAGIALFFFPLSGKRMSVSDPKIKRVFTLFIVWTFFIVVRGTLTGHYMLGIQSMGDAIKELFFYRFGEFGFLVPLIVFVPVNMLMLPKYKKNGIIFSIVCLLLAIMNWDLLFSDNTAKFTSFVDAGGEEKTLRELTSIFFFLTSLVVFLALQYKYFANKSRVILVIYLVLYFFVNVHSGGRGGSFMSLLYLAAFFLFLYKYSINVADKRSNLRKSNRMLSVLMIFAVLFAGLYLFRTTDLFDFLLERTFEDGSGKLNEDVGRAVLMEDMIKDFNSDPISWLIGRGVHGSYSTVLDEIAINGRRGLIEWGFMHFILKGGIPYLFMYVYLLLYGAYMGLRRSNNLLCKSSGAICLLGVIGLISQHIPAFLLYYVIEWLCFALVINPKIRTMEDAEIYTLYNKK